MRIAEPSRPDQTTARGIRVRIKRIHDIVGRDDIQDVTPSDRGVEVAYDKGLGVDIALDGV